MTDSNNAPNLESSTFVLEAPARTVPQTSSFVSAGWFAWVVCLLGAFFYCYEYLLRTMPGIMEPELRQAFQLDSTAFGNLMGFYYYAYTPMQFPVGILIDRYGPRRLLILASLICASGSSLFSMQSSLMISQLGRFLVGFGSAFAFVGFLKLATIRLHPKRFALISGLIMTLCMLGVTQGNVLIAFLSTHHGWKQTTLLFAALGFVLAAVMALVMPKNKYEFTSFNGDTSVGDLKMLCKEMVKLSKKPIIWANGLVGCLLFLSLSGFAEAWGVSYFEQGRGYSKEISVHLNNFVFW
ncbi:MAG TPA: MFS transporter, partial [Gammaproteobacteria bacterium]|nr:MFS transporter [Gammaproteobacteria bacterium]